MKPFRREIVIGVVSAVAGAVAGSAVTWSLGATVVIPRWVVGALVSVAVTSAVLGSLAYWRLWLLRRVRYDKRTGLLFARSADAENPGPFCSACYYASGGRWLVNLRAGAVTDDGTWYRCESCERDIPVVHSGAPHGGGSVYRGD